MFNNYSIIALLIILGLISELLLLFCEGKTVK